MKKLLTIIALSFGIPVLAAADDALPIRTIQSLYSHAMEMDKHIKGFSGNDLLAKFSTPSLKKVFDRESEHSNNNGGEPGCLNYDVMWQTNDDALHASLYMQQMDYKYIVVGIGETEGLEARSVTYEMSCTKNKCLINDIFENGESFKKYMTACQKEL